MLVPFSWLKKYVETNSSPSEIAHLLTMAGVEIDEIKSIGDNLDSNLIIGKVINIKKHPNADRLSIADTKIDENKELSIICGAPNLKKDQLVVVALPGTKLFNPKNNKYQPLKETTIRGVPSSGMICSEIELGIGTDHDGILVLGADAKIGQSAKEYLSDTIFNASITPNRPDCLSILGIAREVAALCNQKIKEPDLKYTEITTSINDLVSIEIKDPDLCSRYAAKLIKGVKIKESPPWLKQYLNKVGHRSINNIVDITNFVMLEYGQPLHAFDFDLIENQTVLIRKSTKGEQIHTLDEETLALDNSMLTISDTKGPIALAGIIGGTRTAVNSKTTSILLEAANFNYTNIRQTRSKLNQNTEASYRFERNLRPELVEKALHRATQLIFELTGAEIHKGVIDVIPKKINKQTISVSTKRIKQVLGTTISKSSIQKTLLSLGFSNNYSEKELKGATNLTFTVPYWRSDIKIQEDVIEELARIIGYDSIPTTPLASAIPHHSKDKKLLLVNKLKDVLVGIGMNEILSYPLVSISDLEATGSLKQHSPLKVSNPMNDNLQYLRTDLRSSILKILSENRRFFHTDAIRLFEIGRTYISNTTPTKLPVEKVLLTGVLSGTRLNETWLANSNQFDFFDGKGLIESMFSELKLPIIFKKDKTPITNPGRSVSLMIKNQKIGFLGEVSNSILQFFELHDNQNVIFFELDVDQISALQPEQLNTSYISKSRFPTANRDLSFIVNQNIFSQSISEILESNDLVISALPIDIYEGTELPAGKKAITFRVRFQSSTETLKTEKINNIQNLLIEKLASEFDAELRELNP